MKMLISYIFSIQVSEGLSTPLKDINYLYKNNEKLVQNPVEGKCPFIRGREATANFLLKSGKYIILCFSDKPGDRQKMVLSVSSKVELQLT